MNYDCPDWLRISDNYRKEMPEKRGNNGKGKKIAVIASKGEEMLVFETITACAQHIQTTKATARNHINAQTPINGWLIVEKNIFAEEK
jgi:putative lipase involved disintegration of autophagic bodies